MDRYAKGSIRRILSVLVTVAVLTVSLFTAAYVPVSAASKPVLSDKSATITVGSEIKLTVKNPGKKVKWKSSNKKIAYVRSVKGKYGKTAVIKAKKAGSCRITAKVGKKKLTCTIKTEKPVTLSKSTRDLTASVKAGEADALEANSKFTVSAADFSFDLLRKTVEADSAKGRSGNTLISPDSVLSALAMTENGAQGQTLLEMQNALSGGISVSDYNRYLYGLNSRLTSANTVKYSVANSIWIRSGAVKVKNGFLKTNKTYHKAQIFSAPFNRTTVNDMNKWVSGCTNGMIKQIISELTDADRIVLINAIAFEGSWEEKFGEPRRETFTPESGTAREADMLHQKDRMDLLTLNGGKGFVKYYSGRQIAFVGLLPPEGSSADKYLQGISGSDFVSAWNSRTARLLDISVPEFKYDYDASMADPLRKMGMVSAFSTSADFSGMIYPDLNTPGIHIDDVIHKTHIELDKNGTKAAAATAVIMKAGSVMREEDAIEVHLDRPFVYALVDTKTGIPLFAGILREATK